MHTPSVTRRTVLATATIAGALSVLPLATSVAGSDEKQIRPFKHKARQADLDDLRRRIKATHFPEREVVDDNLQSVRN